MSWLGVPAFVDRQLYQGFVVWLWSKLGRLFWRVGKEGQGAFLHARPCPKRVAFLSRDVGPRVLLVGLAYAL